MTILLDSIFSLTYQLIMFISTVRHYWLLSTFRRSPADSNGSTVNILVLYAVLFLFGTGTTFWLFTTGFFTIFAAGFVISHTLIMIGILIVLQNRRQQSRFRKTLSSYLGVSVVITVSSIAITALTGENLFIEFVLACWHIAILGYIFHKSIEVKFWVGLLTALILTLVVDLISSLVLNLLFFESLVSLINEETVTSN